MKDKRKKPVKLLNDRFNEIIFKPNKKKVVIGTNTGSWSGSKYRSFKCKSESEAMEIGKGFINKNSRKKIN